MRLKAILVIVILLAAGYFGYQHFIAGAKNTAAAAPPQGGFPVEAAKVRVGELKVMLSTVGTLKSNESVMLRPEMAGRVEHIYNEGTHAKKGELLVQIDDRMAAAELKQAEAALNLARVSYDRAKMLKQKGAGTVSNYDNMAAALSVTQAQVDLAKVKLEKMKILAPFDGMKGLRKVSPGDYVNVGQDIAGFTSNNPMKADFTLPENATQAVAVGQEINVQVDALPDHHFAGKVYAIDPQIDEMSRNISLRAMISNDDGLLKPGLFARVSIITAEKPDAMFVPESAIMPRGNDSYVMRIDEAKKIATVQVKLGARKDGDVEILSGLAPADVVVTAGHLKVKNGQEVSYQLAGVDEQAEAKP